MSFLRGRLGVTEGKYFKEENELAASKLRKQLANKHGKDIPIKFPDNQSINSELSVDVLPEILRHTVPMSVTQEPDLIRDPIVDRQIDGWGGIKADIAAREALRSVGPVPSIHLGRKKYQLDASSGMRVIPSTANMKRVSTVDVEKMRALRQGLTLVSKAFGVATVLVYGGGAVAFVLTCRAIGAEDIEELPARVGDVIKPKVERMHERWAPLQEQAKLMSAKWQLTEDQQSAVGSRFAESLGVKKTSSSQTVN